jgi:hypothetical protein
MLGVNRAHTLQAADFDGDGDRDLFIAQMHISAQRRVMTRTANGVGTKWDQQVIAVTGLHVAVGADVEADGNPDLFGSNFRGSKPVRLWLNRRR